MLKEGVLAKRPDSRLRSASFPNSKLLHALFSLLNGGETLGLGFSPVRLFLGVFVSLVFFLLGISLVIFSVFCIFLSLRDSRGEKKLSL